MRADLFARERERDLVKQREVKWIAFEGIKRDYNLEWLLSELKGFCMICCMPVSFLLLQTWHKLNDFRMDIIVVWIKLFSHNNNNTSEYKYKEKRTRWREEDGKWLIRRPVFFACLYLIKKYTAVGAEKKKRRLKAHSIHP